MSVSPSPTTPRPEANASSGVLAGGPTPNLWRRMACWLYEGMLMFGVVFIAGYLFGTLSQTRNAMDNRHALQAFLFVVFGIYSPGSGPKARPSHRKPGTSAWWALQGNPSASRAPCCGMY